jgi:hypothetical protein
LRQTSGALRQTEGSSRPRSAQASRKSGPGEALKPHGEAGGIAAPEIHRCLKHLSRMRRRGSAPMPRGAMRNPLEREALKPGRQKRAAPNINCMGESCGKLEATQIAQIFLQQGECFFAADARRREKRGCHGLAEKFPQICHAAVRLSSYAAFSRASQRQNGRYLATPEAQNIFEQINGVL